jgi:uncharacterized protein (DUF58 family)
MRDAVVLERLPLPPGAATERTDRHQRRRIYIFFTRPGAVYCLMLMTMLVGAVNYNNSMAYILCFLLTGLFLINILHTYRNLCGLIIHLPECQPVHAGERVRIPLVLENRSPIQRIGIRMDYAPEGAPGLPPGNRPATLLPDLAGAGLQSAAIYLAPLPRGIYRPGQFRISSTFPLGLCRAWSYIDMDRECVVYPAPAGIPRLPEELGHKPREQPGRQAGSEDFTGHRPYHNRDPVRMVDWKKYAAGQGLLIKRFSGGGTGELWLRWPEGIAPASAERWLSQFAMWIIEADRQGLAYGLDLHGLRIEPDLGEPHKHRCLRALAAHDASV